MSTNFVVSYLDPETDLIHSVYGHWDGYYAGAGVKLLRYYNSIEKAKELVAHGSISVLDKTIGSAEANTDFNHLKGHCLFYHRDRGDKLAIRQDTDYDDLIDFYGKDLHFFYFFIAGRWICMDGELAEVINELS